MPRSLPLVRRYGHAPASFGAAFAIGTALNLGIVAVEGGCGNLAESMALLGDADHVVDPLVDIGRTG